MRVRPIHAGTATRVLGGAAQVLSAVLAEGVTADSALAAAGLRSGASAPGVDPHRAGIAAVALGTLRWYLRLAPAVLPMLAKPGTQTDARLRALLVCAVHQLEYSSHPPATTVAAAVDAARLLGLDRAAGLINAILRRYLRERAGRLAAVDRNLAARHAHPDWLVAALKGAWPAELESILVANNAHPPLSLRVDLSRTTLPDYVAELAARGLNGEPIAGIATALTLTTAVAVGEIPGFAEGRVSVQDPSAQLAAQWLAPKPGERVLDACAAPGGKTGALLEMAGGPIELIAVDDDAPRLQRVNDNLTRLGRSAQTVHADLSAASSWWDGRPFDAILLDAPCSGSGVIRRHPDIKLLRRATDIAGFAQRQLELLYACMRLLKPGGRLLYVTCSVLPAENTDVVAALLAQQPEIRERPLPPFAHAAPHLAPGTGPGAASGVSLGASWQPCRIGAQVLPGAAGDGFYYACLTR